MLAVMLLPAGLLGDLLGRKPMTLASLMIFGVGSAWSAYSGSPGALIAARVLMGVGAALVVPLSYSWLIALFPENERTRAMGVLGGAGFVGRRLQRAAIELVERQGYQATSVDEICDQAEVSRSTFFRYFGSKDAVFQSDLVEADVIELLDAPGKLSLQALGDRICAGLQALLPAYWEVERRRMHLLQTVPELRTSLFGEVFRPFPFAIDYVAKMLDLPPDSLRTRTVAGAIIGALAAHQLPDANGTYELPASTEDAIRMYRDVFRELESILNLDRRD